MTTLRCCVYVVYVVVVRVGEYIDTPLKDEEDKKDLGGHTLTTRECMEYVSLSVGVRMSLA